VGTLEAERARRIRPNPGDWGIDVLVGDLNDRVCVWQAKFFLHEFGHSQRDQVRSSFRSAMAAAARLHYRVERWTLCVPRSMDAHTIRWWHDWSARQRLEHAMHIELWDETELRRLLLRPQAEDVRRAYYDPTIVHRIDDLPALEVAPTAGLAPVADRDPGDPWRGGDELRLGDHRYVLLEDPVENRLERGDPVGVVRRVQGPLHSNLV
jgi:hypothetical protein